jgi:hypothetical protein
MHTMNQAMNPGMNTDGNFTIGMLLFMAITSAFWMIAR